MEAPPLHTAHVDSSPDYISLSLQPVKLSSHWAAQLLRLILLVERRVWWDLPSLHPPPPPSSSHMINNLKFNSTNLKLLQIRLKDMFVPNTVLQFWEVTTSSRQIKYTTSIFNICVLCSLTPWCWHFTLLKRQIEKYASTNFGSDGNKSVSLNEKNFNHSAFNGTVGYQTDQTPPIT